MIKKYYLPTFLFCLSVFILSYIYLRTFIKFDQQKYKGESGKNISLTDRIPRLSLNDLFLFAQKEKKLSQIPSQGKMFFSFEKKKLAEHEWIVEVTLAGDTSTRSDAADLTLLLLPGVSVSEISEGEAFPIYPRKIAEGSKVIVTGVAKIQNNVIHYGEAGKTYAILKFKSEQGEESKLFRLNIEESGIFLSAKNIADQSIYTSTRENPEF